MSGRNDGLTFEEAVERLEGLVGAMEDGNLSLDECLARFEQAVSLSRYCTEKLEAAEKQVALLTESGARLPFGAPPPAGPPAGNGLPEEAMEE
jgi:exodeoxyribonuclease VII small subunit